MTDLMRDWLSGQPNEGILFECPSCTTIIMDEGREHAARPRFLTVGWQQRPAAPMPPSGAAVTAAGGDTLISWDAGPYDVEVYLNGLLTARTSSSSVIIGASTENPYSIIAIDAWGQTSEPVDVN